VNAGQVMPMPPTIPEQLVDLVDVVDVFLINA
jgi:hypothetical protein